MIDEQRIRAGGGVRLEQVVKRFGDVEALRGISFSAAPGQVLGLLGPNGAGKTTAVRILATLIEPDEGRATVAGHDVATEPDAVRRALGLTGQFAAVDDVLTGRENLVLFAQLRGLKRVEARTRAEQLLDAFSLTDAGDQRAATYSGGMRRRLDLATSLVVEPQVLVLDEPTTGLDPRSRIALWDQVRQLRDRGLTVLLTTQYLEEADLLADHVVVIDHGAVVAEGTPAELKSRIGGVALEVVVADPRRLEDVSSAISRHGLHPNLHRDRSAVTAATAGSDTSSWQLLAALGDELGRAGIDVDDLGLRRPTLDDVFLALTGVAPEHGDAGVAP